MARLYTTGNYFFLDLETTNGILSDSVGSVRIWEKVGSSGIWVIESDLLGRHELTTAELKNEADEAYTLQDWKDFYLGSTGFNGGGSSSLTTGFVNLADDGTTPEVFSTTPKKLLVNGLGSATELRFKPLTYNPYDLATNKIQSIKVGATGVIRVSLNTTNLTSNPTRIDLILDIGGGATPTIVIATVPFTLRNVDVQPILFNFDFYALETFLTNGGQLFLQVNSGTVTVSTRSVYVKYY